MPAIVTNKFRLHNAKSFIEGFDEDSGYTPFANTAGGDSSLETNMYLFIGKVTPWTESGSDDTNPPNPTDSVANTEYQHWRDMIAAKKITHAFVSHVIPRINWQAGNNYFAYSDTENELYLQDFYVVTDEYNVYKCLANNLGGTSGNDNGPGGATTEQPTHLTDEIRTYNDGYTWKFMYQISAADALKYVTPNYIPVKRVRYANNVLVDDGSLQYDMESAATDGAVHIINKTANGSGYAFHTGALQEYAHATNSIKLAATASSTDADYVNSAVYITSSTGNSSQQALRNDYAVISAYDGATKIATLTTGFSVSPANSTSYSLGPQVIIAGDGDGLTARADGNASHQVTGITVLSNGSGYSTATATIVANSTATGATADVIIPPKGGHGYDAVEELGGFYVMINSRLEYDEAAESISYFTVNNDFRKIGLLSNPNFANGTLATSTLADQAVTITVNTTSLSGGTFNEDELVVGADSGMTGRVVDFTSGNTTLRLIDVTYGTNTTAGYDSLPGSFQIGEQISVSGGAQANINTAADSVQGGDFEKFSGNVLYVENRSPITRASDQIEDIKLVIEF